MEEFGVFTVRGDMCRFGMSSEDSLGSAPVKKPTGWMTNSLHISDALEKRCSGGHRHVQLTDGRARACQVYPVKLSLQILRGFRKQLQQDGHLGLIGSVCCEEPVEDENFTEENWKIGVDSESTADGEVIYYDDISGAPLKSELVDAAIQEDDVILSVNGVHGDFHAMCAQFAEDSVVFEVERPKGQVCVFPTEVGSKMLKFFTAS